MNVSQLLERRCIPKIDYPTNVCSMLLYCLDRLPDIPESPGVLDSRSAEAGDRWLRGNVRDWVLGVLGL